MIAVPPLPRGERQGRVGSSGTVNDVTSFDGTRPALSTWGPGDAPVVVLVHGLGLSSGSWEEVQDLLVPALVIHGSPDPEVSEEELDKLMGGASGGRTPPPSRGGHMVP